MNRNNWQSFFDLYNWPDMGDYFNVVNVRCVVHCYVTHSWTVSVLRIYYTEFIIPAVAYYNIIATLWFKWKIRLEINVVRVNGFLFLFFETTGTNELHHQSKKPNMISSGTLDRKLRSASPVVMSSLPVQTSCRFRLGQQDDFKSSSSYSSYRDYRPR